VSQERTEGLEAEEKREQGPDTEREVETEEGNPT
jgi:hypothetical protein